MFKPKGDLLAIFKASISRNVRLSVCPSVRLTQGKPGAGQKKAMWFIHSFIQQFAHCIFTAPSHPNGLVWKLAEAVCPAQSFA